MFPSQKRVSGANQMGLMDVDRFMLGFGVFRIKLKADHMLHFLRIYTTGILAVHKSGCGFSFNHFVLVEQCTI